VAGGVLAVGAPARGLATAQEPSLEALLQTVAAYVARYERDYSAIVSRERYEQQIFRGGGREVRTLESEMALVATEREGWVFFRDVYAVDGQPVRDRQDRLVALFQSSSADLRTPADVIAAESARYNLGPIARTINVPTLPLLFLREGMQPRSTFRLGGTTTVAGIRAREVRFEESSLPRVIATPDDAAASGRVWVDPANGTIVRTEFQLRSEGASAKLVVTYARDSKLTIWLPVEMTEDYYLPAVDVARTNHPTYRAIRGAATSISGRARYDTFRRFSVDVVQRISR
jgi:hypothetical protein